MIYLLLDLLTFLIKQTVMRDKKTAFTKSVELETMSFRSAQLFMSMLKISQGASVESTDQLSMEHLQCVEYAQSISDQFIPDDYLEAAFRFCRWFLYNSAKPSWVQDFEEYKLLKQECGSSAKVHMFSKLHLMCNILDAGNLNTTVAVDHHFFIDEDMVETQYTYNFSLDAVDSIKELSGNYVSLWPDAVIVGIGCQYNIQRLELTNDDKNNLIIDAIDGEYSLIVKTMIDKNSTVYTRGY